MSDTTRGIGDNVGVESAEAVTERLRLLYDEPIGDIAELKQQANGLPTIVTSDENALEIGAFVKKVEDLDKKLESFREVEKQPYLRGGNAVDTFFFGHRDELKSRRPNDRSVRPGLADILRARVNSWNQQKDAEKRARLEREHIEAQRRAREEIERHRKAEAEAQQARLAEARARSEASRTARQNEAMAAAEAEAKAKFEAAMAAEKAEEARLATKINSADLVRVQGTTSAGAGVTITSRQEGYAMLTNRELIDMEALRPYFTDFELEKAIRAWAKATNHQRQMPGAEVGFRQRGVIR